VVPQGWSALLPNPAQEGGGIVTVFEALMLMIAFGSLIATLFSKKQ